jgi:hypothetical protein
VFRLITTLRAGAYTVRSNGAPAEHETCVHAAWLRTSRLSWTVMPSIGDV